MGNALSWWRSFTYVLLAGTVVAASKWRHYRAQIDPILSSRIKLYFEERAMEGEVFDILAH